MCTCVNIYKERAYARMFRDKSKMRSHFGLRGLRVNPLRPLIGLNMTAYKNTGLQPSQK